MNNRDKEQENRSGARDKPVSIMHIHVKKREGKGRKRERLRIARQKAILMDAAHWFAAPADADPCVGVQEDAGIGERHIGGWLISEGTHGNQRLGYQISVKIFHCDPGGDVVTAFRPLAPKSASSLRLERCLVGTDRSAYTGEAVCLNDLYRAINKKRAANIIVPATGNERLLNHWSGYYV